MLISTSYNSNPKVCSSQCDRRDVLSAARAYTLMKDLTDSPALSLGPAELEAVAVKIGRQVELKVHLGCVTSYFTIAAKFHHFVLALYNTAFIYKNMTVIM